MARKPFDLEAFGAALVRPADVIDVEGQTFLWSDEPMKKTTKKSAKKKTGAKRPALARFGRKVSKTAQYGGMMAAVPPPRPGVDSQRVHDAAEMAAANAPKKQTGNPLLNFRVKPIVHEALKHLAKTGEDWRERSVGALCNKAVMRFLDLAENKKRLPKAMVEALAGHDAKLDHRWRDYR